jgi:fatty-acyl-CoA synthase
MIQQLRSQLRRATELSRDAIFALDFVGKARLLQDISIQGVASFTRDLRRVRIGPHLAVLFHARTHPDRPALICGDTRWSYSELNSKINQLSRCLALLGLSSGEAVALMLPNCSEHVVAQETMPRIGAVAVQIGNRLKCAEIAHVLDNASPQIMIYHYDYEADVRRAIQQGSYLEEEQLLVVGAPEGAEIFGSSYDEVVPSQSEALPARSGDGDGGVIIYTSGTTGSPKGASRSWKDTDLFSVADMMRLTGMRSDDRHLVVCPLYHSAAQAFVKMMTSVGATIVLADKLDAEETLALIQRERISSAFMVPTMLVRINSLDDEVLQKYDCSSLRWVMSGAAPLATSTAVRFQELFGPVLHNFYGATETGTVTHAKPEDHGSRPGSVGQALRGNEIRILDDDGDPVAPGEVGELYVRNGMIISGYHKNPEATQSSLRDGFFSVGDLARMDEEGYVYLASRKHDMVISGGINIYPREIEEVLHGHAKVVEAAVIGIPDDEWGEALRAFIVIERGATLSEDDILQHCRDHLAGFKQPRSIVFMDELPRNPTGKILKRELRDL